MIPPSRSFPAIFLLWAAAIATASAVSCGRAPAPGGEPLPIASIEDLYADAREIKDAIDVTRYRGATTTPAGEALADLVRRYNAARAELERALAGGPAPPLSAEDERAIAIMRKTFDADLGEESIVEDGAGVDGISEEGAPGAEDPGADCDYDPEALTEAGGYEALSDRLYECFSDAARSLSFDGEAMDRLTVFGLLPLTDDPGRRRDLWLALSPIWEAVNGDSGPDSPYRTLVRANAARLAASGEALGESVRGIGVEPAAMEKWLVEVLKAWRDITPGREIEPWDFAYEVGRAHRALRDAIPAGALRPINDRFYRDLGVDPVALGVQYDLAPRPGKTAVAFCTFGRRPRLGDGGEVVPGEPWVFASYQIGGLDNLLELLHETGHAVHIAAIRTRPAFAEWPDSDIFTEGIADVATLEMYEPAWQRRYLRASVPIRDAIAAKYAGIVMDIAWALFEVRMHREPERDPNRVWTEITREYFRIRPHPDRAWWAVRGQLVSDPGYMMNYAAGAILNADVRARIRALHGAYTEGRKDWYGQVSASLYRFGLEKSSKEVIEDLLGRPVSPQALLDDMARGAAGALTGD